MICFGRTTANRGRATVLRQRERGAELVEFAFVLPIFIGILLALIWSGRAYNAYETLNRAGREGARFALAPSCASCGNAAPTTSEVATVVANALKADGMEPKRISALAPAVTSCSGGGNPCSVDATTQITVCRDVLLNNTGGGVPPQCGVAVGYAYPLDVQTQLGPWMRVPALTLKSYVQMTEEQ
ncbi:MAG TPA: TadE/TadG family type IV pilus assembly protein [Terriglobia bacterium]|nr:TadE/TadG family type IV pilus assembly protein [Terriglobia bacterium]